MSIDTVLGSLRFWGRDSWSFRNDATPLAVSAAYIDLIARTSPNSTNDH